MKKLIMLSLIFSVFEGSGQSYAVSLIPDSLMKNADMVVRSYVMTVDIKSASKAIVHEKYAYTIMNQKGDDYADFQAGYSKLESLDNAYAQLLDAGGKEIRHIKEKDMTDRPAQDGFSLMQDDRIKYCSLHWQTYPYTVEFETEYELNGILGLPSWAPQSEPNISVLQSVYQLNIPSDYEIRYRNFHGITQPVITDTKNGKAYYWEVKGIAAKDPEYFSPEWNKIKPLVLSGPSAFEIQGYKGNMASWNDLGKFFYTLAEGQDELPDPQKKMVHDLVDKLKDPKQKIAALYKYLQDNTHYISVQLGIGGWQPFDAKYVASNRYGDCKALSNYMVALLKEAGIKGNLVFIKAGRHETNFNPDFVGLQFNHVICCVPLVKDTVWLDCVEQYLSAGYLGYFTANRYALLIDKNGGTLVHTPAYKLQDNIQRRKVECSVDEEGNLQVASNTSYKAACQDRIEELVDGASKEQQLEYLKREMDLPTFDIVQLDFTKDYSALLPVIDEQMKLTVSGYAQVTGKRLFINPNLLNRSRIKYEPEPDRKYNIELKDEFEHQDSVDIAIPAGYTVESLPKPMMLETRFGRFITTTSVSKEKIIYIRTFFQYSGVFPSGQYDQLVKFYDDIYRSDRSMVVLVKEKS